MKKRISLLSILLLAGIAFFLFDLGHFFSLEYIKSNQQAFLNYYSLNPVLTIAIFFAIYVLVTGLSLPGATIMTLIGGALFGFWSSLLIISFASTLGATLAFLLSRFLLRDNIQQRFSRQLASINQGVRREGAFYLFTLRLVPIFPFFIINLGMGLTPIKTWTFYWVSQVGMLAGTIVYVNAGTQLGQLESLSGIISPGILLAFTLLGIFPLAAKKVIDLIKTRQLYAGIDKPARFDANLIVIGAGAAGLVTSYIAAAVKAKVSLVEKHKMGGDCLNTGCVPSKALIRSARFVAESRNSEKYGIATAEVTFNFADVMDRVSRVVTAVEPHDSIERYTGLGVDCVQGEARILTPYEVVINGEVVTTRNIVIATGARPRIPAIRNIEAMSPLTSDNIWKIRTLPKRLLVLGGGPVGCELGQCFARFGSQVTIVLRGERLMPQEDPDVSQQIAQRFTLEGITILPQRKMREFIERDGDKLLICEHDTVVEEVAFDQLLLATGRQANTEGFGLENLELGTRPDGTLEVNEYLQTQYPNVFACGDICGPYQLTHAAAHQAWYAAVNALFGQFKKFKVDYSVIPAAIFTDPEVARVGLNEQEAQTQNIAYEVSRFDFAELDRAIVDSDNEGFVKVLTVPGKDRILGATIVGPHAGELITEYVTAMKHGLGLNKILATIHIYPSLSEANKYAAGAWKKNHAPQRLLALVEKYHRWMRGQK
ncbi:MAG: dihydrolipoyl dehydrogenase [Neptuniibacter caesariensis]|uniref:Dihydrolipoyl dehydrogenase n=1 Tax=Neptuniibacter caesariensis TaxID=207954 RepID=A0A2G6JAZ7_NEPCE|nr:MAG: dihydrolipoyl dehydrogenase [Neptuniibacter caesariensis]